MARLTKQNTEETSSDSAGGASNRRRSEPTLRAPDSPRAWHSSVVRQFLRISNGIFRYRWQQNFSLRSTKTIIQQAEEDEAWDDLGEDFEALELEGDDFGPIHRFIIGTGDVTVVCAFDPDTLDEHGEMKVIEFDVESNPPVVHSNLEAFFRHERELYKQDLARELKDRAKLGT